MNPEITPQFTPEQTPREVSRPQGAEYVPLQQPILESAPERSAETDRLRAVDQAPAMPAPPPVLPMPTQPQVVPMPAPAAPVSDDDNPVLAGDDDLIEKEWVDKAKKIVAETRNEPYKLAQEVSKLQADYLSKRYGKEIGIST